jgi:hypothetical protein
LCSSQFVWSQLQQQYEIEAMQAIYGEDFRMQEAGAWGNPSFSIVIKPISASPIYCTATLRITFTKTYPRSAPTIALEAHTGLTDKEAAELQVLLDTIARKCVRNGEVFVHVLTEETGGRLSAARRCV